MTVRLIAPGLDVLAGVEMPAPLAAIMDRLPVGEQRPAVPVERRPLLERQVIDEQCGDVLGIGRAGGHVDQVLEPRHGVGDRERPRRIRACGRNPAERGAGAHRDGRHRTAADLAGNVERRSAPDRAIAAVGIAGNRALDERNVLALVLAHRLLERAFRLAAGGRHQGLVIIERDGIENEVRDRRMTRTQEGFGITGAVLKFEPDQNRALLRLHRRCDRGRGSLRQAQHGGHAHAEPHEVAPGHALALQFQHQLGLRHLSSPLCKPRDYRTLPASGQCRELRRTTYYRNACLAT